MVHPLIAKRSKEAIYLARELYRHASCFFDDHTRDFLRRRIRDRFRECKRIETPYRQSKLLKSGRKWCSTLQRANAGHFDRIETILMNAYGRTGKWKHELLKPYLVEQRGEPLVAGDRRTAPPIIHPKLLPLLQHFENPKKIAPNIPAVNIWNKSFPPRRKANILWRHFTKVTSKVKPPLPEKTMLRLEALASGAEAPILPKRKTVFQCREIIDNNELRNVTARFQRRMYAKVLLLCPRLIYNEPKQKYQVKPSEVMKKTYPLSDDLNDFAGVNSDGSIPKPKKGREPRIRQKDVDGIT